jgi:MFS family permease
MLGVFSVTFIAFAVPAGILGAKIGRKITILIGLGGEKLRMAKNRLKTM